MVTQTRRLVNFLKENHVDIVHTHDFYSNIFGMTAGAIARTPVRIASKRETSGTRSRSQRAAESFSFRLANVVVANAGAVKQYLLEQNVPNEKIEVIYNGIDLTRFSCNGESMPKLPASVLDRIAGKPVITMVANFEFTIKDHPMLLRAATRVIEQEPNAFFVIAGDGELREQTERLAIEMGLQRSCLFLGRCDSVPQLLQASDICVLSSQAEGFSNSILEYMAAARPVIATNVGGASEAIVEGETGYLVQTGDDAAMADRIISLLRNPQKRQAMGEKGRKRVADRFSCESRLLHTSALYTRMLT
jgi:glycosyltransferase involved in cell wall biosynthesis